jgi:carbamate kinase
MGVDAMAGTAVVAMRCADDREHVPAVADGVRALSADRGVVLVSPGDVAGAVNLAIGTTRSGRRAVPVVTHILVDPADPAFAHLDGALDPAPLGILETEAISALVGSGFPVVVTGHVPVVPCGGAYEEATAILDEAAAAQRLAGDLGAPVLIFVVGDGDGDGAAGGEIDVVEAEGRLAAEPGLAELRAAVRFLRAGGELAVITTAPHIAAALDGPVGSPGSGTLRIHRHLARVRPEAPALAAGWCLLSPPA